VGIFTGIKKLFAPKPKSRFKVVNASKRFDLIARLGQGSMSKVWRARDQDLGRTVCLKLLDRVKTAKFEDRFRGIKIQRPTEGEVCASLRHQNVVQTYDYGITTEKEQFLVMELIEGMGLNFLVETQSRQLQGNRINFLSQMADGLEYIHGQGYLHRDICPRNVMVTANDIVKLIDFGLTIPNVPEFLKPGNRTGTPNYLAPELIKRTTTDQRVDMFALGVTAYEVITTKLPWEKAESLQTLLSHLNSPGRDPRDFMPDLDEETAEFLIKAIDRDPSQRFQTPAEFRNALRALPER
jgi:serine/threonine protein kinase